MQEGINQGCLPTRIAVHRDNGQTKHELYCMCDSIAGPCEAPRDRNDPNARGRDVVAAELDAEGSEGIGRATRDLLRTATMRTVCRQQEAQLRRPCVVYLEQNRRAKIVRGLDVCGLVRPGA